VKRACLYYVFFLAQPSTESSIVIGSLVSSWSPVWSRFLACVRCLEFRSRSMGTVVGRNASLFRVVWRGGRPKCHRRVYSTNAVGMCRYLLPFEHNARTWQTDRQTDHILRQWSSNPGSFIRDNFSGPFSNVSLIEHLSDLNCKQTCKHR